MSDPFAILPAAFRGDTPLAEYLAAALASMGRTKQAMYDVPLTRDDLEAILTSLPEAPDEPQESSEA